MCGLIGFIPNNPKNKETGKHILEQYQEQLMRGQRGFGLLNIDKNSFSIERAVEPIKALIDTRLSQSPIQLFHHRTPTSTENKMEQTHPFLISHDELDFDYLMMHNGVISNSDSLFAMHTEELGYVYKTHDGTVSTKYYKDFNDSESLAIELARYFDGKTKMIGTLGSAAFIIVSVNKTTGKPVKLTYGRNNGNPLELIELEEGILIASEINYVEAETITGNTAETIDLKKYFANKTKHASIRNLITSKEIQFIPYPTPVVLPTPITTQHIGYRSSHVHNVNPGIAIPTKVEITKQPEPVESNNRELAFEKMAERAIGDISTEIFSFFHHLCYTDLSDDECALVASSLNDLLIEKSEIARDKVRPYFDKEEIEFDWKGKEITMSNVEIDELLENIDDYRASESNDDEEIVFNRANRMLS